MGEWMKTIIEDHTDISDNDTTKTVKIPRANMIGDLNIRLSGTGGASLTTNDLADMITKIEVIGNGASVIRSLKASDERRFTVFDQQRAAEITESAGAASGVTVPVDFGRFPRDTLAILPAQTFKSLQLKLYFGTLISNSAFTTGTVKLDVLANEYVSDEDPLSKIILKRSEIDEHTSAAQTKNVEFSLGNPLRRAMVFCTNGQADLTKFYVRINNGTIIPMTSRFDNALYEDLIEYKLASANSDVIMVDFDKTKNLTGALPTGRYNDLFFRYDEAAGSTVRTVSEELVRVVGATRV